MSVGITLGELSSVYETSLGEVEARISTLVILGLYSSSRLISDAWSAHEKEGKGGEEGEEKGEKRRDDKTYFPSTVSRSVVMLWIRGLPFSDTAVNPLIVYVVWLMVWYEVNGQLVRIYMQRLMMMSRWNVID